jgi:rhodanese-related sulfurtransferase
MTRRLIVISPTEADAYIDQGWVLIDLREKEQYKAGHLKNAINMPYEDLDYSRFVKYRNRGLLLYCERGASSMIVGKELAKHGYYVASMAGGIRAYRGNRLQKD